MSLRHLVTATTLGLVAATLMSTPAEARVAADRQRDGDHGPQSVVTSVPPGGTSTLTSPTISTTDRTMKIRGEVTQVADHELFERFTNAFGQLGKQSKRARLLVCTMVFQEVIAVTHDDELYGRSVKFDIEAVEAAAAIALACMRFAGFVYTPPAEEQRAAVATACPQLMPQVPARITQTSSGYRVSADGVSAKAKKKKAKLKISCKLTERGSVMTIKPKSKKKTLRQVVGTRLAFTIGSPADADRTVPVKVTFS